MKFQKKKGSRLKVLALGGWAGVNQNMFVYETDRDILIIDCGVDFPDETMSEVEVIIPDVSYLKDKINKIRGLIISHGHMDHFGALPFILPQIGNPPIFATKLVRGFIEARLAEFDLPPAKIHLIDPQGDSFRLGSFETSPFLVNHSVPDSMGLCLQTPVGKIFHVSDFKFDFTPVDGRVFQIARAARLASPQTLALFSDCLGAAASGFTSSEREIEKIFDQIIDEAEGQVFITTVSSNISRFQQAIRASLARGRQIVLLGRSVREKVEIAQKLGYLDIRQKDIILSSKARKLPQNKLTYLVAGSYGQPDSALSRLAEDDYRDARLEKDAVVIFSADPSPPGSRAAVDLLVDKLTLRGAKVHYYEIQENLHASGHGSSGDIRLLFSLIEPQYLIPIGGDPRHIRAYSLLAEGMGMRGRVLELFDGEVLEFTPYQAQVVDRIKIKGIPVRSK